MRARSLRFCLSAYGRHPYSRSLPRLTFSISHRYQSTDADVSPINNSHDDGEPNILHSDESILGEIETFAMTEQEETISELADSTGRIIVDGIEYFQPSDFRMAKFFPVKTCQFLLDWAHDFMPYWFVVLTVPWLVKAFLIMPWIVYQNRKYESIVHLVPKALEDYAYLHNFKNDTTRTKDAEYYNEYRQREKELKAKYGFNPYVQQLKQIGPIGLAATIHMGLFFGTRTMYPTYPDWKVGGTAWFTDLSLSDPYYVWPTIAVLNMIGSGWIMARNLELSGKFPNIPTNVILYATTGASLIFIPVAAYLPVGFDIYLASNIMSYLMQTSLMENSGFRKMVGLKPKSYADNWREKISEKNQELKHIVRGGTTKAIDPDIKGKRAATGKVGRRVRARKL